MQEFLIVLTIFGSVAFVIKILSDNRVRTRIIENTNINDQEKMALEERFTYLLGPIRMAIRPRIVTAGHLSALGRYCRCMWQDSQTLEKMWLEGALDDYIGIEEEELEIASMQPWMGGPAIFASDGLFSFGAHPEEA